MAQETWPGLLTALLAGTDLSHDEARWAMEQVMSGEATPAQVAGLAVALRAKGETAQEVSGLVDALLAHAVPVPTSLPTLDVVGTGGDRSDTVNISTMAAIVAAGAGAPVIKHGNRAASSMTGTADVLEALGVVVALPPEGVLACLDVAGIGFCFAPAYHPSLRHAAGPRRELGVPTVFNILGPLANPARSAAALVGCADRRLAPIQAEVLSGHGCRALVVRGEDGLDEVSPYARTRVWDATGSGIREDWIDPADFGIRSPSAGALAGGSASDNAEVVRAVMAGDRSGRLGVVADTVVLNAAAALAAYDAVAGTPDAGTLADRMALAWPRAQVALVSGRAAEILERWIGASRSAAAA